MLHFAALAIMLQAGLSLGISAADSLFLVRVGADKLPIIYLLTPVMMLVYIALYTWMLGRVGVGRTMYITLTFLVGGGVLLFLGLEENTALSAALGVPETTLVYVVKLYTVLWFIALYTLLWNFIDSYFDILDAKRLFAFFSGGIALGTMIGGGLTAGLVQVMRVQDLFLVWSGLALLTFPVVWVIQRRFRQLSEEETEHGAVGTGLGRQLRLVGGAVRESRYVKLLIAVFLTVLLVTTLCEYQYMTIFQRDRTEAQVASLFGQLYAGVNVFNLFVNLVLFNRLVAWIGVRNTALIQPIVYAITFSYFLLDYGFGAALAGFVAYQGLLTSIDYNNQNFLFNALPSRAKAQVRTFIEGLCEPLAVALGGLFLLYGARQLSPEMISTIALGASGVALALVFWLRGEYVAAMVANLQRAWLDFSGSLRDRLSGLRAEDLNAVRGAAGSEDPEEALEAIRFLWWNEPMEAVNRLTELLDRTPRGTQAAAAPLLGEMLDRQDSEIVRRLLLWQARSRDPLHPRLLEEFGRHNLLNQDDVSPLARSPDPDQRAVAAVALWNSWKIDGNLQCIRMTHEMMEGTPAERRAALRVLGRSGQARYAHYLVQFLTDPEPEIRRETLASIRDLADEDAARLTADLLDVVRRHPGVERREALEALERIGDPGAIRPVVLYSDRFAPDERRAAERVIARNGLQSVPALTALLREGVGGYGSKSMAARTLARLSFPQFEAMAPSIIRAEIARAYEAAAAQYVLTRNGQQEEGRPGAPLLGLFYADMREALIDFVLEVLTLSGRLPDFELMASSLRSNNPKDRANALETIEQGCTRRVYRQLLPLIDGRSLADLTRLVQKRRKGLPALPEVVQHALRDGAPALEQACAVQAAWGGANDESPLSDGLEARLHALLRSEPDALIEDVIFALVDRSRNGGAGPGARRHALERAEALLQTDFFRPFGLLRVADLAVEISEETADEGTCLVEAGQAIATVYVVLEGRVRVGAGKTAGAGDVIGEACITRPGARSGEPVVSDGATLLRIDRDLILETAATRPRVAIELLRRAGEDGKEADDAARS